MTLYRSEPGVAPVRIHSYPKRRKQPRYPGLTTSITKTPHEVVSIEGRDNPCYGDFFVEEHVVVAS